MYPGPELWENLSTCLKSFAVMKASCLVKCKPLEEHPTVSGSAKEICIRLRVAPSCFKSSAGISPRTYGWALCANHGLDGLSSTANVPLRKIHAERQKNLIQVVLCLVICRYQVRMQRHVHWEQPKGSSMMCLPYVQEIYRYLKHAKPDLCVAGDLKDPKHEKLIKKGLHIATSSMRLFLELHPLKCHGLHEHQVLEGTTSAHGQTVSRATFPELYPRRFARRVAKVLLRRTFPVEKPVSSLVDPALTMIDVVCAAVDKPAKRLRISAARAHKTKRADRTPLTPSANKKVKTPESSESLSEQLPADSQGQEVFHDIVEMIEPLLPRVGRKQMDQPTIMQAIQKAFPDKIIKCIMACKGNERTMGPPSTINAKEAPYRRATMKLRSNDHFWWTMGKTWHAVPKKDSREVLSLPGEYNCLCSQSRDGPRTC